MTFTTYFSFPQRLYQTRDWEIISTDPPPPPPHTFWGFNGSSKIICRVCPITLPLPHTIERPTHKSCLTRLYIWHMFRVSKVVFWHNSGIETPPPPNGVVAGKLRTLNALSCDTPDFEGHTKTKQMMHLLTPLSITPIQNAGLKRESISCNAK